MNLLSKIPKPLTRFAGKLLLKAKGASPEICVISGIIAGGTALVMVGVKTWKNKDKLEEDVRKIKDAKNVGTKVDIIETEETNVYGVVETKQTEVETKRDLTKEELKVVWAARIDFGKDIAKTYWQPILLGISAIGLVWGGRTLLRRRLSEMTALCSLWMDSYGKLCNKIRDKYGEQEAEELIFGAKTVESVDSETGEVSKITMFNKKDMIGPYAQMFDPGDMDEHGNYLRKNYKWTRDKIQNRLTFIEAVHDCTTIVNYKGYCEYFRFAEKVGLEPKEWHYHTGWRYREGEPIIIEVGVLEGPYQLECNKPFTDDRSPQNYCVVNPNIECIDDILSAPERFDRRIAKKLRENPVSDIQMFGVNTALKLSKEKQSMA